MKSVSFLRSGHKCKPIAIAGRLAATCLVLTASLSSSSAFAVDGCQVLLCLAAPNWRASVICARTQASAV